MSDIVSPINEVTISPSEIIVKKTHLQDEERYIDLKSNFLTKTITKEMIHNLISLVIKSPKTRTVDIPTNKYMTVLYHITKDDLLKDNLLIKAIIKAGADVNQPMDNNDTLLYNTLSKYTFKDSETELIHILLENGADPTIHSKRSGMSCLGLLCTMKLEYAIDESIIRKMIDNGCNVNEYLQMYGTLLLHHCVCNYYSIPENRSNHLYTMLKILISSGANPDLIDEHGKNARSYYTGHIPTSPCCGGKLPDYDSHEYIPFLLYYSSSRPMTK